MRLVTLLVLVSVATAAAAGGAAAALLPPPELRPDLHAFGVRSHYGAQPGESYPLYASLWNRGDGPASDVLVRFFVDGVLFEEVAIVSVETDRFVTVTTADWTVLEGRHEFRAVADPADDIAEWNEEDNEAVTVVEFHEAPELAVTDITWTPAQPTLGAEVTFTATVANVGDVDAGPGQVRITMSSGGRFGYVGSPRTPAIPVGGSVEVLSPTWLAGSGSTTDTPFTETVTARANVDGFFGYSWPGERSETYSLARPGSASVSGGDANGVVAVSLAGHATGAVAVSGTGDATGAYAAASGTGDARGYVLSASGTGDATSAPSVLSFALAPTGDAAAYQPITALGTCNGQTCVAASPDGDAEGWYAGVSGTGDATGGWFTVSGTGDASCWTWTPLSQACVAASGTGDATGIVPVAPFGTATNTYGGWPVSVTGECVFREARAPCFDVAPTGPASGYYLAVSGDDRASSQWIAVAPSGDARGWIAGTATGQAGDSDEGSLATASGTGSSYGGTLAASGAGRASSGGGVPVSGTGNAAGFFGLGANYCDGVECFAIEPAGDARGHWLAVATSGRSTGDIAAVGVGSDAECIEFNCVAVAVGGCATGSVKVDACGLE